MVAEVIESNINSIQLKNLQSVRQNYMAIVRVKYNLSGHIQLSIESIMTIMFQKLV